MHAASHLRHPLLNRIRRDPNFVQARTICMIGGPMLTERNAMTNEGNDDSNKERRIMRMLRTVLGNIVKDTAPRPGMPSPLQEGTIESIRELFAMIAEREAELAQQAGLNRNEKPYFADEPRETSVVTLHRPDKGNKLN